MTNKKKFSRRNFIERSIMGIASSGLILSGSPLIASPLGWGTSFTGKPFKLGIIGCGNRAVPQIRGINQIPELEIAALCDIVPEKMEEKKRMVKRGTPKLYTDYQNLLRQDDLDVVAIITPNYLHREQTVAAFEAGKHVLCEKPMALNVKDCNAMIAAAKEAGKALQIGTQRRHETPYRRAIEKIHQGEVGKILYSDISTYRSDWAVLSPDPKVDRQLNWRLDKKKVGGVAFEQGAHTIDLNNWIIGSEPVEVIGRVGVNNKTMRPRTSDDHAAIIAHYANGAVTNYGGNLYHYGPVIPDYYFAEKATISLSAKEFSMHYGYPKGVPHTEPLPKSVTMDLPPRDGELKQWQHFVKVMKGEAKAYPDGITGRMAIQVMYGAEVSTEQGCAVKVSELG